ncbi:MAG TPA: antibiotic biosynthesis monooxygenase [Dehalococcoidia bacterium]|nr:antibiotic biosynthesis monooxygenase [Dehalococcoidia bacterium]
MSVLVLIEARAKPEMRDELRAFLQGNMHEISSSPGNESVAFHSQFDDPNVLLFVEYWDNRESYDKYLAWRYERGDHARMVAMMDGEVSVRVFDILATSPNAGLSV